MSKYLVVAMIILTGLFFAYFKITQDKIEFLNKEIATLEVANETNQATINGLRENAAKNEERNRELQASLDRADVSLNTLRKTLQEHNLTRLAAEKPGLIEPRMQGATDDLFENYFSDSNDSTD